MDFLATIEDPYLWLALGLLLAAAEILVPGMFLIWLAGAALITGVLALSGMLMMDVVRNMWSWNAGGPTPTTSIMDGLLSALGIR